MQTLLTSTYSPQGPLEHTEAPASEEGSTPSQTHPPPTPHTKSNLSTGALPLVGSHNQVGDHHEDIVSLRSQRGIEEPSPTFLGEGTLLPKASWQCEASAWVLGETGPQNWWIRSIISLTLQFLSRYPLRGPSQTHKSQGPCPMNPYSKLSHWGPSPNLGGGEAVMGLPLP